MTATASGARERGSFGRAVASAAVCTALAAFGVRALARVEVEGATAAGVLVAAALVWCAAAVVLARAVRARGAFAFGWRAVPWSAPWGAVGGALLAALAPAWLELQRTWLEPGNVAPGIDVSGLATWQLVVLAGVVAAIAEELFFRGAWVAAVSRWGDALALLLPAAAFALAHAGPERLVWTFALGLALGWARLATRALAAPVALHAAYNATLLLGGASEPWASSGWALVGAGAWVAAGTRIRPARPH